MEQPQDEIKKYIDEIANGARATLLSLYSILPQGYSSSAKMGHKMALLMPLMEFKSRFETDSSSLKDKFISALSSQGHNGQALQTSFEKGYQQFLSQPANTSTNASGPTAQGGGAPPQTQLEPMNQPIDKIEGEDEIPLEVGWIRDHSSKD